MSVNDYRPHLKVLPEDDANSRMATGFELEVVHLRQIQVLAPAGGWLRVCEDFQRYHQAGMRKFQERRFLLLLDFDAQEDRRSRIEDFIAIDLKHRVFVLGVQSEPEALRQAERCRLEEIGRRLAAECRGGTRILWQHPLLHHNAPELARLMAGVRHFLF